MSLPFENSIFTGTPKNSVSITIQPFDLWEFGKDVGPVVVELADGVLAIAGEALQVQVFEMRTGPDGPKLIDSLDQIPLQLEISEFSVIVKGIYVCDCVFGEVHKPYLLQFFQRPDVFDIVFMQVQDHEVLALPDGLNIGYSLSWQRYGEDDFWRKFVADGFEHGEGDLSPYIVALFAVLGEITEFLDVDVAQIGPQEFGADVVVFDVALALFGHRYNTITQTSPACKMQLPCFVLRANFSVR